MRKNCEDEVHFSRHVLEELEKRKIPQKLVERVLYAPEQKVPEVDDVTCYQIKWRPAVTSCRGERDTASVRLVLVFPPLWR